MPANVMSKKLRSNNVENSLYSTLGVEDDINALSYTDLPEFTQKNNNPYQTVIIHLRNKEDLKKLSDLLGQPNLMVEGKRSNKTTWFPELQTGERGQNALYAWMDEEDPRLQELMGDDE